jgi:arylsulfatase A-like enzyme
MDQLRADHLGCYGNPDVKTPNINRLASEGCLCDRSVVSNPVCMPSRASMFTGQYPQAHGLRYNGCTLPPSRIVLPEILRQNGYQTASIGKIHLSGGPHEVSNPSDKKEFQDYEEKSFWEGDKELPLPYYGLEYVYLVDGHGNYAYGSYKQELAKKHPGMHEKLQMENASYLPKDDLKDFGHGCWEQPIPEEYHYNTYIADKTIDYIKNRDKDKPFFVWCSFPDPHHPYTTPKPYSTMYDPDKIQFNPKRREGEMNHLPKYMKEISEKQSDCLYWSYNDSDENFRTMTAYTYGMISMVDKNIGRIMDSLNAEELTDDTIIVFLSDHGDMLGDHGLNQKGPFLFESLVRVPTIWRFPDRVAENKKSDALVSTVDFCPTVLDMLGIDIPGCVQGRSYKSMLRDGSDEFRDWAYIEFDTPIYTSQRQIRSKKWALTYDLKGEEGMLFDLEHDPDELNNLWNDPKYKATKNELLLVLMRQSLNACDSWENRSYGWRD